MYNILWSTIQKLIGKIRLAQIYFVLWRGIKIIIYFRSLQVPVILFTHKWHYFCSGYIYITIDIDILAYYGGVWFVDSHNQVWDLFISNSCLVYSWGKQKLKSIPYTPKVGVFDTQVRRWVWDAFIFYFLFSI